MEVELGIALREGGAPYGRRDDRPARRFDLVL
jgi:hypothetical protein